MLPLGSGALAGSGFPFDRDAIAEDLNFPAITRNSMDVSADRDFALDFLYACSLIMLHLSRLCRRLDSLFERRVRVDDAWRWRDQRIEPDAAEEESGFARTDPRQIGARVRRSDFAFHHNERPAA